MQGLWVNTVGGRKVMNGSDRTDGDSAGPSEHLGSCANILGGSSLKAFFSRPPSLVPLLQSVTAPGEVANAVKDESLPVETGVSLTAP